MHKQEFLARLRKSLSGLPEQELEERVTFYSEIIDDRMEEGRTEEEAVSDIGSAEAVAVQLAADGLSGKPPEENRPAKRRLKGWEVLLLALGSPIWVSLLVAAFAVILSLYAVLWALLVSLWAVFVALLAGVLFGILAGTVGLYQGNRLTGIAMVGAALFCAGITVLFFFLCKETTRGALFLTKRVALGRKTAMTRKGTAQ